MVLIIIFYFLNFFSCFCQEHSECEVTCKDEIAYIDALTYYSRIPVNQTLVEKNKDNPIKEEMIKSCDVNEVNKYIKCMGKQKNVYASSELLEHCTLKQRIGVASCIFEHKMSDRFFPLIWRCLFSKTNFEITFNSFYKILSDLEYFQENATKYNNQILEIKKIFCVIRKDFREKNPNFTDKSNFLEILGKNEKMVEIADKIKISENLKSIFACMTDMLNNNAVVERPWIFIQSVCKKMNESEYNSNALLENLYPLNEKIKIINDTEKSNQTSSKRTTIIIIVIIISIITLISIAAIILYKKNKN